MACPDFQHEYDLESLILVRPRRRKFSMYVTPRYQTHYEKLPFEAFSADLVVKLVPATGLFIDVGAHYGFYTLLAAQAKADLEVIACEPTPETCQALERNVRLNQLANVKVLQAAVSDTEGSATFNISLASDSCGFAANPMAKPIRQLQVATHTLTSLMGGRTPCPTLIKIDTEGHEVAVLRGLQSALERFPDVRLLLEYNPLMQQAAGYREDALLSLLLSMGFHVCVANEQSRSLMAVTTQQKLSELVTPKTYANLYCTRGNPIAEAAQLSELLRYSIDLPANWKLVARQLTIDGWCFAGEQAIVNAVRARRKHHIWQAVYGLKREDVARMFPGEPTADESGFQVKVTVPTMPGWLHLEAQDQFGRWHRFYSRRISKWRCLFRRQPAVAPSRSPQDIPAALAKADEVLRHQACVFAISHCDYRWSVGGTQKALQQEQALLAARGISYVEIHPSSSQPGNPEDEEDFTVDLCADSELLGSFAMRQLLEVLEGLARSGVRILAIHAHHLKGFQLSWVDQLLARLPVSKTFFIHDFYSVCRQHNLLKNEREFCGGPPLGSETCRECSFGATRPEHFESFKNLLGKWRPHLIAPSVIARDTWAASFPELARQVRVLPHMSLVPISRPPEPARNGSKLRLAYVGYQHPFKGWEEWKRLVRTLAGNPAYELYLLGSCTEAVPGVKQVPVCYITEGTDAMVRALRENAIDLAFLWSVVPETYSFTLFESMAAPCFILTNPRSGNIAAQVRLSGGGLIAQDLDELNDFLKNPKTVAQRLGEFRTGHGPLALEPNTELADELSRRATSEPAGGAVERPACAAADEAAGLPVLEGVR